MTGLLISQAVLDQLSQRAQSAGLSIDDWLVRALEIPPDVAIQAEKQWELLANTALEGLIVLRAGQIIEANQALLDLIGYSHADVVGQRGMDFVAPQDREWMSQIHQFEEKRVYHFSLIHRDGTLIPVDGQTRDIVLGTETVRLVTLRDVREDQAIQEALLQMYERLNLALDSTLTGIWEWYIATNQVIWSETVEQIMGLEIGSFDGTYAMYESLIHPDDLSMVEDAIQDVLSDSNKIYHIEHRILKSGQQIGWILARGKVIFNQSGQPVRLIGIVEDITERKNNEFQQRERENLIQRQNEAITELASNKALASGDWDASLREITRVTSETLDVNRISVWLYHSDHDSITCEMLYDRKHNSFSTGQQLFQKDYPLYFEAILQNRIIVAPLAQTDPITQQFSDSYLKPNNIHSLLDAPIRVHGEMVGIVCCEEVDQPCVWTLEDQHFVSTIADLVALAMEGYERRRAEGALHKNEQLALEFQGYLKALHEVTIELASIDSFNHFYQRAIELAREKLGFDRIGLLLIDEEKNTIRGTWGTDDFGNLRDESNFLWHPDEPQLRAMSVIKAKQRSMVWENVPLMDNLSEKGMGWSAMAVMWQGDRGIGWLACDNLIRQESLKPYQLDLLTLYAASLGNLINLKQGEIALKGLVDRLRILQEVDHAILRAESLERTSQVILEPLKRLIGCDYAAVWVVDSENRTAVPVAHTNIATLPKSFSIDDFYQHHWENLQKGDILSMDDLGGFPLAIPFKQLLAFGVRSVKVIPMHYNDELVGTLALGLNQPSKLDAESIQTGREVAAHLAVALRQAWLYQQVQNYAEHLEKMVTERTSQLQEKASEMEAFTYSVSHDLRAPLRAINGFSLLLQESYADALPEKGLHYLARIQNNAQRMGALIDDLLALSRIGRREMHLQPIDPTRIVLEIIEELSADDQLAQASIHVDTLPHCDADPTLLKQAYTNLITNAIKYAKKDSEPIIYISSHPIANGKTVYSVKDNGIGFDMQYADKLFGVFQRLHGEDYEGTGIGLATVRRIVNRHGGRIWAEANVNQGATFFFTLSQDSTE